MSERTIEDILREEYFDLLADLAKLAEQLETEISFHTLPIARSLAKYERVFVTSRIKSCDSAVDSLRRRQEGGIFDTEKQHSLLKLRDLVGVRVLAFPRARLAEIDEVLRRRFHAWESDPVTDESGNLLAYKYFGPGLQVNERVTCEYQIASMLTGLFWQVEHSAIYKPAPELKGMMRSLVMRQRTDEVYAALRTFEEEFEQQLASVAT
jgi:hypothetical protein